jgi:hypothetical protein
VLTSPVFPADAICVKSSDVLTAAYTHQELAVRREGPENLREQDDTGAGPRWTNVRTRVDARSAESELFSFFADSWRLTRWA